MANIINTLDCSTGAKNVGFGSCVLDPKKIIGAIEVPAGDFLSAANLASQTALQTALLAKMTLDSPLLRWYPIYNFENIEPGSDALTLQTMGYGGEYVVREGYYKWLFQFVTGGLCLLKALRTHNGTGKYYYFIDEKGVIYGRKSGVGLASTLLPIPMQYFHAQPFDINTGAAITAYKLHFVFQQKYLNDFIGFVSTSDFDVTAIGGLQDVSIEAFSTLVAGVVKVQVFVGCDHTNLYDAYSAVLAVKANWVVKNKITGNAITITTDVIDAANKAFTFTLDTTDPDYPAAAADLTMQLVAPTALATAGMPGYESNILTLTV